MSDTTDILDMIDGPTALATRPEPEPPPAALALQRAPEIILTEAHAAAKALTDVISKKSDKVMMNGEQYLEFEDWQTLGRFYGVTARVVQTGVIRIDDVLGFEATAEAVRADGFVLSRADAMCLNDEPKWSMRAKYEWHYVLKNGETQAEDPGADQIVWEKNTKDPHGKNRPKKKKVQVGEEHVPLFQLRSMAQTRACAKALRNVLAWVVVMAGYRPTPAEEIDAACQRSPNEALISIEQQKALFKAAREIGWKDDELADFLKRTHGVQKTADIPVSKYGDVLDAINQGAF